MHCKAKRQKELSGVKNIYKLGGIPGLPFVMTDIDAMKLVNMHLADPFTRAWMQLYIYMLKFNKKLIDTFPLTHKKEFTSIQDYEDVYYYFLEKMKSNPQVRTVAYHHKYSLDKGFLSSTVRKIHRSRLLYGELCTEPAP